MLQCTSKIQLQVTQDEILLKRTTLNQDESGPEQCIVCVSQCFNGPPKFNWSLELARASAHANKDAKG